MVQSVKWSMDKRTWDPQSQLKADCCVQIVVVWKSHCRGQRQTDCGGFLTTHLDKKASSGSVRLFIKSNVESYGVKISASISTCTDMHSNTCMHRYAQQHMHACQTNICIYKGEILHESKICIMSSPSPFQNVTLQLLKQWMEMFSLQSDITFKTIDLIREQKEIISKIYDYRLDMQKY